MTSREDFNWTDEAKNLKEGLPPNNKRTHKDLRQKYDSVVHIKLDRSTLPKDGQSVSFQTQDEEWHDGYFIDSADLFWINDDTFFPAFDIVSWKAQ